MRRFLVLAAFVAGCARPAPPAEFTLKVAVVGSLAPLAHDTQATASTFAADLLFEAVFQPDGNGIRSRVLARWERRGDRLRAYVADGLVFSDGSPVTVDDVARSIATAGLKVRRDGLWLDIGPGADGLPVDAVLLMAVVYKPSPRGDVGTGPFRLVSQDEHRLVAATGRRQQARDLVASLERGPARFLRRSDLGRAREQYEQAEQTYQVARQQADRAADRERQARQA